MHCPRRHAAPALAFWHLRIVWSGAIAITDRAITATPDRARFVGCYRCPAFRKFPLGNEEVATPLLCDGFRVNPLRRAEGGIGEQVAIARFFQKGAVMA